MCAFYCAKYLDMYPTIGADTVLKLGAEIFYRAPLPQKMRCAPILRAKRGHTTVEKIDIVKITRVKSQGTVDLATS